MQYLRPLVSAILALGIVGAACYELIVGGDPQSPLIAWAGTVVGIYIGVHAAAVGASVANGKSSEQEARK